MGQELYWKDKQDLVDKELESWDKKDQINVRKLILMSLFSIPENGLKYYLSREQLFSQFVLGDTENIDHSAMECSNIVEKADLLISKIFYSVDYKKLNELVEKYKINTIHKWDKVGRKKKENPNHKKDEVCEIVKMLISKEIYEGLSEGEKNTVSCIEKIYFEPIGLFNEYVEELSGDEVYYTILMEQWKTANEMAANISLQRNNMNNFYMSLMSILIGGIMFSDKLLSINNLSKSLLFISIAITGVICCLKWIAQIQNYGKLNGAKYEVINELERQLPANVMLVEYMRTEKNPYKDKNRINFSKQERDIAKLFIVVIIVVTIVMLISIWMV